MFTYSDFHRINLLIRLYSPLYQNVLIRINSDIFEVIR